MQKQKRGAAQTWEDHHAQQRFADWKLPNYVSVRIRNQVSKGMVKEAKWCPPKQVVCFRERSVFFGKEELFLSWLALHKSCTFLKVLCKRSSMERVSFDHSPLWLGCRVLKHSLGHKPLASLFARLLFTSLCFKSFKWVTVVETETSIYENMHDLKCRSQPIMHKILNRTICPRKALLSREGIEEVSLSWQ